MEYCKELENHLKDIIDRHTVGGVTTLDESAQFEYDATEQELSIVNGYYIEEVQAC